MYNSNRHLASGGSYQSLAWSSIFRNVLLPNSSRNSTASKLEIGQTTSKNKGKFDELDNAGEVRPRHRAEQIGSAI